MRYRTSARRWLTIVAFFAAAPPLLSSQARVWVGHESDYERFLRDAEIVSVEDLGRGANEPKRVTLRSNAQEAAGLWKPIQRGPKEWAWESFEAEVAAYELDRMLGLEMVPPTVVRAIGEQPGSLQLWVNEVKFLRDRADVTKDEDWDQQVQRMRLFDNLIGNGDRSDTNVLVDAQDRIVLIDHSQAFVSTHYLEDDDEQLPMRYDRRLVAKLEGLELEHLRFRFGRLLLEPQIRAIIMRRDGLLRRLKELVEEKGEDAVLFGPAPDSQE